MTACAFPLPVAQGATAEIQVTNETDFRGLTKTEYIAAHAMQGLIAAQVSTNVAAIVAGSSLDSGIATAAKRLAEALLAEFD